MSEITGSVAGLPLPSKVMDSSFTDEEFFYFCQANDKYKIERRANGLIYIMAPVGLEGSKHEFDLSLELGIWNRETALGIAFSSTAGFTLPDNSVLSPDAAWITKEKWEEIPTAEKSKFARVVPDFVAEIRSSSDRLPELHAKMEDWLTNGVRLAWLLDPHNKQTWIYRPGREPELLQGFSRALSGEEVLPGFSFDLSLLS